MSTHKIKESLVIIFGALAFVLICAMIARADDTITPVPSSTTPVTSTALTAASIGRCPAIPGIKFEPAVNSPNPGQSQLQGNHPDQCVKVIPPEHVTEYMQAQSEVSAGMLHGERAMAVIVDECGGRNQVTFDQRGWPMCTPIPASPAQSVPIQQAQPTQPVLQPAPVQPVHKSDQKIKQ